MKVLNLRCSNEHAFEGWFGSEGDFQSQLAQSLLQCPVCGTHQVRKMLSAPRLNLGAKAPLKPPATSPEQPGPSTSGAIVPALHETDTATVSSSRADLSTNNPSAQLPAEIAQSDLQAAWWHWARRAVSRSDNVGPRFAEEARRMHQGDVPERAIHGQASVQETLELLEEGISVLPLPDSVTDKLH